MLEKKLTVSFTSKEVNSEFSGKSEDAHLNHNDEAIRKMDIVDIKMLILFLERSLDSVTKILKEKNEQ